MENDIRQTWQFNQSPEEVWAYLTQPTLIEQWLMKTDFQPVVGRKFQFTFVPKDNSPYDGTVDCEVLEVKPFTHLAYTWNGYSRDRKRSFLSTVIWTLSPNVHGTELQLQHNGLSFPEDILNHTSGWKACLKRIEDLLIAAQP
jgi:uncharacterized protein YndB with AHSA1/START domain